MGEKNKEKLSYEAIRKKQLGQMEEQLKKRQKSVCKLQEC